MAKSIMYVTDENYQMQTYVSIYSLLENNTELGLTIYIVSKDNCNEIKSKLSVLKDVHNDFSIEFVKISGSEFKDLPEPNHLTKAIYYRLLITSILPVSGGNVLYLDSDTIITSSISDLFDMNMNNTVAAATPHYRLLSYFQGLSIDSRWYNTGVLYINIDNWKQEKIEEKSIEYIKTEELGEIPIQNILNTVLNNGGNWKPISPEYNYMYDWQRAAESENQHIDPKILHFAGGNKPWMCRTVDPNKQVWWEYLQKTPYSNYVPPDENMKNKLIWVIDYQLEKYPNLRKIISGIKNIIK